MSWMPEDWMPQWLEESGYVGGCDVDEEAASPPQRFHLEERTSIERDLNHLDNRYLVRKGDEETLEALVQGYEFALKAFEAGRTRWVKKRGNSHFDVAHQLELESVELLSLWLCLDDLREACLHLKDFLNELATLGTDRAPEHIKARKRLEDQETTQVLGPSDPF